MPEEPRWQIRVAVGGGNPSRITARRYLCAACNPAELVAWYRDLDVDWRAMPPLAGGART